MVLIIAQELRVDEIMAKLFFSFQGKKHRLVKPCLNNNKKHSFFGAFRCIFVKRGFVIMLCLSLNLGVYWVSDFENVMLA